jgi:hypothetical protein
MAMWHKTSRPVDRAMEEIDRQIAELQKQLRQVEHPSADNAGAKSETARPTATEKATRFIKNTLATARKPAAPSLRARADLFEVGAEPLKELEADAIAFARKPNPDLFSHVGVVAAEPGTATAAATEKLAHYLSAGSIKTYKPLKRVRRQARNRFFMWLGLSFVAFWVIYVVVR